MTRVTSSRASGKVTPLPAKVDMPQADKDVVRKLWTDLVAALAPPAGIPEYREAYEELCATFPIPEGTVVEEVDAGGVRALLITHPGVEPRATVLWDHSGGYVFGSADGYRAFGAALSLAADARVLMVDYRLAPEHPHPAALDDSVAAYRWLLKNGTDARSVVVGGDSAGGGLALATLLTLHAEGDPRPAACVVVSPVADYTLSGESMTTRAHLDPIASAEMLGALGALYRGDVPTDAPSVSPLLGDLSGLPPLLAFVGSDEVLHDDAARLVEKAAAHGVEARLVVGEGHNHIWPLFLSILPEGQDAVDEMGAFISSRTATV